MQKIQHETTTKKKEPLEIATGLCPGCGSIPKKGWVGGWRGWICGSYCKSHYCNPPKFEQSATCGEMGWQERALRAEAELAKALAEATSARPR